MSRVLPILFNTDMVKAILREVSTKTATRRAIKGYIPSDAIFGYTAFTLKGYISCRGTFADGYGEKFFKLPCQKGDTLYVRETWHTYTKRVGDGENCRLQEFYGYRASVTNSEDANEKWRPSIHMPKEAARIWLKVTDVRVERLQDITNEQVLKEGANRDTINHLIKQMPEETEDFIRTAYLIEWSWIWDSTIKKGDIEHYGYDANPWVWVIEFERVEV